MLEAASFEASTSSSSTFSIGGSLTGAFEEEEEDILKQGKAGKKFKESGIGGRNGNECFMVPSWSRDLPGLSSK